MNINKLIDQIKKDVGLNGFLGKVYNDNVLRDSIINNSLETFNRYSGFHLVMPIEMIMNTWYRTLGAHAYGYGDTIYRIPDLYMDRFKELGVTIKRAFTKPVKRNALAGNYSRRMEDDMVFYAAKHVMSINTEHPVVTYRAPGSLVFKDSGYHHHNNIMGLYNVVVECTHPKNLSTITIGLENWFVELCKYDIMINLYNNELRNLKVEIGNSSVDMNLENFQNAESDRKELLQKIAERAGYDQIILSK